MKIDIYVIDRKSGNTLYEPLIEHYLKSCRKFADVKVHEIFDRQIAKAQDSSMEAAQRSYTKALERYMGKGALDIVLDPASRQVDSYGFANLLENSSRVNFFIGGAYGFEKNFIDKSNKSISLGKITLSHKLVKVVLAEQVFRALSIINGHPYHK